MVDTVRSLSELQTLLADNITKDISEQDLRDFLVTSFASASNYIRFASDQEPLQFDGATTGVSIGAGEAMIDNDLVVFASGVTLAYTPSTAGIKHVYLYDNVGTPTLEINDTNVLPVYEDDLGYWHKTGDTSKRRVGAIWVYDDAGTKKITPFKSVVMGNSQLKLSYAPAGNTLNDLAPVSGGTATTLTSFTLNGVPIDANEWISDSRIDSSGSAGDTILGIHPDAGTHLAAISQTFFSVRAQPASGAKVFFGRFWMPKPTNVDTAYYGIQRISGTQSGQILVFGYGMSI